jgi:hypothetical protein
MTQLLAGDQAVLRYRLRNMDDEHLSAYSKIMNKKCRPESDRTEPLSPFEMCMKEVNLEMERRCLRKSRWAFLSFLVAP